MKRSHLFAVMMLCSSCLLLSDLAQAQAKDASVTQGTYKTIFEMLRDIPGLEVKISGDRSGGTVTIRGTGSLNNQKPPLFVIDGVIFGGDVSNINPQDVQGISVLKDAASATAYGAQGAGGVILITTKKGQGVTSQASVNTHTESAYAFFIQRKTPLKIFGMDDNVIMEGVIVKQRDSVLVFMKKKNEILIPIKNIKRVEMIRE